MKIDHIISKDNICRESVMVYSSIKFLYCIDILVY